MPPLSWEPKLMSRLNDFLANNLADRKITDAEVPAIRERVHADGQLNLDDVKLLVELYCTADQRCAAFDEFFFEVLEDVLLEDGEIQPSEQFYLLKMLYSDREIRQPERQFLQNIRRRVKNCPPEFEALCETALAAPARGWNVGGVGR
jgi:hypothetical protein